MILQTESPNPEPAHQKPEPSFWVKAFGSALFTGYSPLASGTAASALAVLLYFWWKLSDPVVLLTLTAIALFFGIKAADKMEAYYGHDPAEVTIDEVVGQWIALVFLPSTLMVALVSFFAFRLMDIVKPFPANRFDAHKGGFGIMMDDVVAGIYANLVVQAAIRIPLLKSILL